MPGLQARLKTEIGEKLPPALILSASMGETPVDDPVTLYDPPAKSKSKAWVSLSKYHYMCMALKFCIERGTCDLFLMI